MNSNFKLGSAYILICLIWGSTWLAIRLGLDSLTPFIGAGSRFLLAVLVFYLIMKIKKLQLQTDKESIKLYIQLGFFSYLIPFGLVYWGQQYVASGLASVIFGIFPFFILINSKFRLPNENIGLLRVIGMIIAFCGIVIIFIEGFYKDFSFSVYGELAILLSAMMQAYTAVSIKKHGHHLNPWTMNLLPMLIGGVGMLLIGFIFEDTSKLIFDEKAILSVLYLGIFGSVVTFTAYYWLMKKINVILLSLVAFITPIIAIFLGVIFLNEQLEMKHIIGSVFVLAGLLIANVMQFKKDFSKPKN